MDRDPSGAANPAILAKNLGFHLVQPSPLNPAIIAASSQAAMPDPGSGWQQPLAAMAAKLSGQKI